MMEKDLRPSRLELTLSLAEQFIMEYFDQNPISQLAIIVMRNGVADKLSELSGKHIWTFCIENIFAEGDVRCVSRNMDSENAGCRDQYERACA
jgi:hypothetical protein